MSITKVPNLFLLERNQLPANDYIFYPESNLSQKAREAERSRIWNTRWNGAADKYNNIRQYPLDNRGACPFRANRSYLWHVVGWDVACFPRSGF